MEDMLSRLFNDFDRGTISRRHLLQALGVAAVTAPMGAFGQGQCGGARAGTPECNTTPLPPPFASTGWKTVLLDHFSLQVAELDKEAAYYNALMGWKVRSNDGRKIVMDMGTLGSVVMRGGLPFPPPTPTPAPVSALSAMAASAAALAASAAALAAAEAPRGGGAAPAGARGGGGGGGGARRLPRAIWNGFCFGIEPWDLKTVEAELKKRGLNPVADHNPKEDFFSFHVKDPDGFDLQISNGNKKNRRTTPANGELNMAPPFEPTGWQTVFLDHISFEVTKYKESTAFYQALLGWKPSGDEGSQNECEISPEIGGLIIRGAGGGGARGDAAPPARRASMGHIAFGIVGFDPDKVLAELQKRGLSARVDTGGSQEIHVARYKSYHTTTPNGYDLQISDRVTRPVRTTGN